jgi:hypothetical protein
MANKKTKKLILVCVVFLSVFSFIFTNAEACHTLNSPDYTYQVEVDNIENQSNLLTEIYFVKEFISRALDILSSNF